MKRGSEGIEALVRTWRKTYPNMKDKVSLEDFLSELELNEAEILYAKQFNDMLNEGKVK